MKSIRWYRLFGVGVLVLASGAAAQGPQPTIRELATIPGVEIEDAVVMPNGRVVLYTVGDSIVAHDLSTRRGSLITRGYGVLRLSGAADRIAFVRESEDGQAEFILTMPIDPRTGASAGPAQRVSVGPGDEPSFSPDGRLIAFGVHGPNGTQDLAVVPATGGPERVLAKFGAQRISETYWSADGRWVFAEVGGSGGLSQRSVVRVPAAGGAIETVIAPVPGWGLGSINGQITFRQPDIPVLSAGRVIYTTSSGARGEFLTTPGSWQGTYIESARSLWITVARPTTTRVVTLADGRARDLLPGPSHSRGPVWSPDGRRLALQTSTGGRPEIMIMNADGSQQRRYPASWDRTSWSFMQWSPNGQMLVYYAGRASVAVLDLVTGSDRVISRSPRGETAFVWRADGTSLVVLKGWPSSTLELYETRVDGSERLLRDISAEFPTASTSGAAAVIPRAFISDRLMVMGSASQQSAVPTDSGRGRPLAGGVASRFPRPGVSPSNPRDARWLLWLVQRPGRPITSVELMTVGGDSLRTLNLPFEVNPQVFHDSFRVDDRNIILVGRVPGEAVNKIFLVPVDGATPRVLAEFSGRLIDRFDLSPDRRSLVYTIEGAPTTTIHELDVTPILQALGIR